MKDMKEEVVRFSFLKEGEFYILIITREKTGKLIYSSLYTNKAYLIKEAKSDFKKLSKKNGIRYVMEPSSPDDKLMKLLHEKFIRLVDARKRGEDTIDDLDMPYEYIFGTQFQRATWDGMLQVNIGHTITYGELSTRLGMGTKGARAIRSACNQNKIPLFVPCHRIMGKSGEMTGFRWGIPIKKVLLMREQEAFEKTFKTEDIKLELNL